MSFQQNSSFNKTSNEEVCDVCFAMFIFRICLQVVFFLVQFTGNYLIVWMVVSTPTLHSTCMKFICNLAIADFLRGLLFPAFIVVELNVLLKHNFPRTLFNVCLVFSYTFNAASLLNLAFMSIDRSMITIKPLKYKVFMTPRKVKTIIFFIWLLAILTSVTAGFHLFKRRVLSFSGIVLVYLVILVSYGTILREVKKQTQIRAQIAPNLRPLNNTQRTRELRLAKTTALVIGIFTLSWSLFGYTMVSPPKELKASVYDTTWGHLFMWGKTLGFMSTAINPVIYFYRSSSLRNSAKTLLLNQLIHRFCVG